MNEGLIFLVSVAVVVGSCLLLGGLLAVWAVWSWLQFCKREAAEAEFKARRKMLL